MPELPQRLRTLDRIASLAITEHPDNVAVADAAFGLVRLLGERIGDPDDPVTAADCAVWGGSADPWDRARSWWWCRPWEARVQAAVEQLERALVAAAGPESAGAMLAEAAAAAGDQSRTVVDEQGKIVPTFGGAVRLAWAQLPPLVKLAAGVVVVGQVRNAIRR